MARELLLIALVAAAGCGRCSKSESAPAGGKPLAEKAFYRLDAGPPAACASGATCEARLVLTALGDYHVNKDYPFKFVGDPAAIPVDGTGSFAIDDAKHLTMTIRFRPTAAGTAKVTGQFKLSVCSDDTCEIETPTLELAIPVS
jgi:hypothetical protein